MTIKLWLSALLLSFGIFLALLLLSVPTIFLILLILILALGSAVLTKVFISESSEDHTILERWLFLFISSLFVNLIGILVEGDLAIIVPLLLIYGFALFIFSSKGSFAVYTVLSFITLGLQFFWYGNEFITYTSVLGYIALFFSVMLFLFLYEHDFNVKNKAFHLLSDQLDRYQKRIGVQGGEDALLIRTNKDLEIISVSQIAQKKLFSYQSSVIGKKLFTVLYIKDERNILIGNNNKLMNDIVEKQEQLTLEKLTLILPNTAKQYNAILSIHPILTMEGYIDQIEFSLSIPNFIIPNIDNQSLFESQKMSFVSLFSVLESKLAISSITDSIFVANLMRKGYLHMNLLEELGSGRQANLSLADSAQLIKNAVVDEKKIADLFKSKILLNVVKQQSKKEDDLFPQTVSADMRELTGPYYTVQTDVQLLENLFKVIIYSFLSITAFDSEKNITIRMNSNKQYVTIEFVADMSTRAQESFRKIFESSGELLKAGSVPYTLGIEGALVHFLLKLTGGTSMISVGAQTKFALNFKRYITKNTQLVSGE